MASYFFQTTSWARLKFVCKPKVTVLRADGEGAVGVVGVEDSFLGTPRRFAANTICCGAEDWVSSLV
eukprot:CAMPEP_0194487038 /NCGR_PEP_ID=MMETSP0253-20130528/7467_1 /TAXON_ID=2966 /ORGANISM="Noctiluca scintillans" /LENGTH=66 /DNA_ID=CAMNT_0039327203 /DNA_START=80 /DNA_END=276 /DNA_ORIENTATION=-